MTATPPIKQTPPKVLVLTWCQLFKDSDPELRSHGRKMLLRAFGDMRGVVDFVKKNEITLR